MQVSNHLLSAAQTPLATSVVSTFTAVLDMSSQVRLDFSNTRANRATGEVSYHRQHRIHLRRRGD